MIAEAPTVSFVRIRAVESTSQGDLWKSSDTRQDARYAKAPDGESAREAPLRMMQTLCTEQDDDRPWGRQIGMRTQETRRLESEENKIPYRQTAKPTVNVETMGTVQTGGSSGSSAGAAQSSSACAAQPSEQLPSRGAGESERIARPAKREAMEW